METIEDVFRAKAVAFSKGEFDKAFKSIVMPTTIYVGEKTLFVETHDELIGLIKTSRDALLQFDYDHSDIDIVRKTALKSDGTRLDVQWRHFSTSGEVISEQNTTYYCVAMDGVWRISLAELDDCSDSTVKDALPLR